MRSGKTRIAESQHSALLRWNGETEAQNAVYANRNRLRSEIGKTAMQKRAGIAERSFAHTLERGGMRRPPLAAWPRKRPEALPDPRRRSQPALSRRLNHGARSAVPVIAGKFLLGTICCFLADAVG